MPGGESRPPSTQFPPEPVGDRNQMCPAAHFPRRGGHLTEAGQTNGYGPHDNGNRLGIGHLSHHSKRPMTEPEGRALVGRQVARSAGTEHSCESVAVFDEAVMPKCRIQCAATHQPWGGGGSGGVRDCHEASPSCLSCKEGLIRPCIRTDPRMTGPIDVPGEGGLQLETTGNTSGHPFLLAAGT